MRALAFLAFLLALPAFSAFSAFSVLHGRSALIQPEGLAEPMTPESHYYCRIIAFLSHVHVL